MSELLRRIVITLAMLQAGYLVFDGTRALMYGNYIESVEPSTSDEIESWSDIVRRGGFDPGSTTVKIVFVIYGLFWLGVAVANIVNESWGVTALLLLAIGSLWLWPYGTISSAVQIVFLLVLRFSSR